MENREIARLLAETADLMEIAGEDAFRVRSYRNGAAAVENHPENICELARQDPRRLTAIPGIGKSLAAAIEEICRRGSFDRRDALLARYPPTALELLKIQGLGPRTIALLWEHYRVSTVDDLERLCREQKLRTLPRLGPKLEEKILRSIAHYRQSAGRFLLNFADQTCRQIVEYLSDLEGIEQITPAGSLRRGKETVGDLDLLVTGPRAAAALERFVQHPEIVELLSHGSNKASAKIGPQAIQVDVRALPSDSYGAALQYFTGSKDHNIALRNRALKLGYSLSEYGLFTLRGERKVAGAGEEEIYRRLGLDWIPPELRENQGEIEAAAEGRLPRLVEFAQIRGDLHAHTSESDGRATLEEMVEAARAMGYSYLAITDHSKALAMANGLDEARVVAFARKVRELNARGELGIRLLAGIECDIRRDGSMDLAADALAELDLVIGSVHSYMNLEPAEMTERLLRALESPYLHILGHPTGRLLLAREGYAYDFERVAEEAARRNVALEINASPERLDLYDVRIRAAKAKGCRFVIATDAHHPRHLENMRYGVMMARRGWLEPDDVLNTLSWEELLRAVARR
ncbi:MAG: DNA polymerase/3'-5' exonuclease PolX [Bryobacterales bacterium]|nr:DNA polymerase/3'-5' exonuclease PolX [Bryobacteraceae bacterium]MDW8129364.1 DNA polymerase/3'-5' exonuclease PolX [Bryobacterales bacterium]